jgi:NAD+ kinase
MLAKGLESGPLCDQSFMRICLKGKFMAIAFLASNSPEAQGALAELTARYGQVMPEDAKVIVALGGDGFMLQTLHDYVGYDAPVYGMNCGTIGFLMNSYGADTLIERLDAALVEVINPLSMCATTLSGTVVTELAINEVSILRAGPQAAKLRVSVDGRERLAQLICDGALLATPAGSTAYNYSAHGPILPIGSDVLALTAIAPFRPRRWRGALLRKTSVVRFDVIDPEKRPVMADADSRSVRDVISVEVRSSSDVEYRILFDAGHSLEERMLGEQFE